MRLIPVRALPAEAVGGDARALRQHPGGLPPVRLQHRVVGRQAGQQVAAQSRAGRQGEPHVRALPHPLHHAGFDQQPQVAGQPGLRLAQDLGELHDAERAPRRQREQPQPGRLGAGAQGEEERVHRR